MNRAERRRQLKQDERLIARGLTSEALDAAHVMALMRVLHDRLEDSRSVGTLAPLMSFFHANMAAAARAAPRKTLACRLGCSHCCRAWVSARAPEVLFITSSRTRKPDSAMRDAVDEVYAVTGTLAADQRDRMAVPCPLLKDNRCQVYAVRPATCQTAVSEDASICAAAFQPRAADQLVPMPEFYIGMRRGYSLALAGALKRSGFPARAYELNAALRAALARDDAEAAWLAGEGIFDEVQMEPGGDTFAPPQNRRLYDAAFAGWS